MSESKWLKSLFTLECMMSNLLAGFPPPVLQRISQEFFMPHCSVLAATGHISQMSHCGLMLCYSQWPLCPPFLVTCCHLKVNTS